MTLGSQDAYFSCQVGQDTDMLDHIMGVLETLSQGILAVDDEQRESELVKKVVRIVPRDPQSNQNIKCLAAASNYIVALFRQSKACLYCSLPRLVSACQHGKKLIFARLVEYAFCLNTYVPSYILHEK